MLAKALALEVAAATVGLGVAAGGVASAAAAAGGGAAPTTGLGKGQAATDGKPTGKPSASTRRDAKGDGPSPSLVGLCRAFAAGAGDNPGRALENPAFTALVTAAGGATEVPAFCADVLAAKASRKPAAAPTEKADKREKPAKARPTPRTTPVHPVPDKPKGAPQTPMP